MVAPLFYSSDLSNIKAGEIFRLAGDEGKHAANVRRMRIGEAIQLTDGLGLRVQGLVSSVEPGAVSVAVSSVNREARSALQFTLVQALAKGDRDELAVQAATELGATGIIPWQASRSVSRWDDAKKAKGQQRWQSIATEAAKQSLRVYLPNVSTILSTTELAKTVSSFDAVLVLDPTAEKSIVTPSISGRVAIVVGPEGGIATEELALLEDAGAIRVHLGAGILRTSTAGLAAISYLVGSSGQWDTAE